MAFEIGESYVFRNERASSTSEYVRVNEVGNDETNDGYGAGILLSGTLREFPILMF